MSKLCTECYKQEYGSLPTNISLSSEPELCEKCGKEDQLILNEESVNNEPTTMTVAECQVATQKHIENVRKYIRFMIDKIDLRGVKHDASKLESPEVEVFAEYTPKLNNTTFGSEDYYANLEHMKSALDHHYASNRHHPEHFVNGINDMTLVDILEMFCDWKASTLRHNDGNLLKSIETNAERFHMDGQLKQILINTARMLDEHED
jgi:hypothetical protein